MSNASEYSPGPASADVKKDGDKWTLVLVRELRHAPALVWKALTDPAQLKEWAPFDADGNLGHAGATVKLSTVGTPMVSDGAIKHADEPKLLEFSWGDQNIRWELEPMGAGTKLSLFAQIDKRYIAMGAAGWQICLDVMERLIDKKPIGRHVGPPMMKNEGWQRLNNEYMQKFGVEPPKWG